MVLGILVDYFGWDCFWSSFTIHRQIEKILRKQEIGLGCMPHQSPQAMMKALQSQSKQKIVVLLEKGDRTGYVGSRPAEEDEDALFEVGRGEQHGDS